jgi:alpha-tubulin suppressor-like RCC1 family protein
VQVQLSGATAIAAGDRFTCAATPTGAYCWGADDSGVLGDGKPEGAASAVPVLASAQPATLIAAGHRHACAGSPSGVRCWGEGSRGQLGNGGQVAVSTAVPVTGAGTTWIPNQLAAGGQHTCAVDTTSRLWCWGRNDDGELGAGNADEQLAPIQVRSLATTAVDVVASEAGTCAQTTAGPRCWGDNYFGQLGDGTATSRSAPTAVTSLASAARPAPAASHTCALSAGEVYCWGDNAVGQLGLGTFSSALRPVEVEFPASAATATR